MDILCDNCGSLFDRPTYEISKQLNFCSRKCWRDHGATQKNKVLCDNCGNLFSKSKTHCERAVRNYCSKECWLKHDYAHNKHFFTTIDDEMKAYWLGFVCADGWLDERDRALGIGLQSRDRGHLEKFAGIFNVEVKNYCNKSNEHCRCMVYSKTVFDDLVMKGVEPRKSLKDDVRVFEYVPLHLYNHFVRGWFDGDGSVYYAYIKPKLYPRMSIVGTELCLIKLRDILVASTKCNKVKVCKNKSIYSVCWGGPQVMAMRDWLYENATIFLQRKKKVFEGLEAILCRE